MDIETDEKYQLQALDMLSKNLLGATWSTYIEKKLVIAMFNEAKTTIKQKPDNKKAVAEARSLMDTLARVVRCLCLEDAAKQTQIRGRVITMDAKALFENAERELKTMRRVGTKR